ncbi:MAG: hypothetical protein PHZ14_05190 [Sulfuricella sp.]|nr:hypothetical protein [Sulfuricella sp.]
MSKTRLSMLKTSRISYGGSAAIVTSMALVSGLDAAGATKSVAVSALLVAALADNLTDSLSIHIFQESEQLEQKEAFAGTVTNFVTRLLVCLSFALLVGFLPISIAVESIIVWGMSLLAALTFMVARERKVGVLLEIAKHLLVAAAVIIVSKAIGHWISAALD